MNQEELKKAVEELTKQAIRDGKLIEVGWLSLRKLAIPHNASKIQVDEMRTAFFAGAQHVFSSIQIVLDPGTEPTQDDLNRMTMISSELDEFVRQFRKEKGI